MQVLCPGEGGRCRHQLHSAARSSPQALKRMLVYAKTKHAKSYPWLRWEEEDNGCTVSCGFVVVATRCGPTWREAGST